MRRTFYVGVGFALGVAATRRTRRAREAALAALTPTSIAANVADAIAEVGQALGGFLTDVRIGMEQRESELATVVDQAVLDQPVPPQSVLPQSALNQPALTQDAAPAFSEPAVKPVPTAAPRHARAIGAVARSDRGWRTG